MAKSSDPQTELWFAEVGAFMEACRQAMLETGHPSVCGVITYVPAADAYAICTRRPAHVYDENHRRHSWEE